MTKYLTAEQVISFHDILLEQFGGLPGIRDKNLLIPNIQNKLQFGLRESCRISTIVKGIVLS